MVAINAFSDGLNRFNCPKCLEFQYNTAQIFPQLLKINMNTSDNNMFERIFKLRENGTNVRTEVMAGLTTFLTMCYIIIVNPLILGETGMDVGAVFVATARKNHGYFFLHFPSFCSSHKPLLSAALHPLNLSSPFHCLLSVFHTQFPVYPGSVILYGSHFLV